MHKWFGLLFAILLIGCKRDVVLITSTPNVTEFVTLPTETAAPLTSTPTTIPTALPTETAAHPTVTQTPTPSPEPNEQFMRPTLPPVTEEAEDSAEHYSLRTWADAEAATLVSLMSNYADGFMADRKLYASYGSRGRKQIIEVGHEFILRYPNSPYRTEVEWQMVDASTYYPSRALDEMLAKLIASDLNTGIVTLETLDVYLQTHGLQISLNDCQGCPSSFSIPNLLGDGREILFLPIERSTSHFEGGVLIAIWQDADEQFILTPIISQWAAVTHFSGGIGNYEARHITGDTQPEFLVKLWGGSGSMLWSSLHMYRWDGEKFAKLAGTPFNFNGGIFGDQWQFVEGDDPSRLQVVRTYSGIMTTIYEWTGDLYETVEFTWESVPFDPTDTPFPSPWIQWEIERGNYTEVIAYLKEALHMPVSSYKPFSPKYYYIMRFLLGINYAYLEDEEMARSVFETLRDEASPPEFIGFSQAAEAFLEQYEGLDTTYEGCNAAYDVLLVTELEFLGIVEMSLCAFDKLFVEKLNQYDGMGSLFDYVDAVEIIHSQQLDLNKDGRLDWLIAISHPTLSDHADVEMWAVLQTDAGIEVVKLTTFWTRKEKAETILAETHSFPLLDTPLISVLWNDDFHLLQLIHGEEGWEIKLHTRNGFATDYSLQMVENDLQFDLFLDSVASYERIDRITYRWDAEIEEFVEMNRHAPNSLGVPFQEALDSAETFILENDDFATAIPILTTIADEFEPVDDFGRGFSLPKTLYLLGLAHEMQGNEAQAVAAYWRLWHDYPTDPYALMAATKLEKK